MTAAAGPGDSPPDPRLSICWPRVLGLVMAWCVCRVAYTLAYSGDHDGTRLFPYFALAAVPTILLVVHLSTVRRWRRRRDRIRRGRCPYCDYDLTLGTSARCPECGHPVPLAILAARREVPPHD